MAEPSIEWRNRPSPQGCALSELLLVIRDSQGNFTADPQCVAEEYA